MASMDYFTVSKTNATIKNSILSGSGSSWNVSVTANVPDPYALLIGNITIDLGNEAQIYNISCINCSLSNCINSSVSTVVILQQPAFVFLPVNISGNWYGNTGIAVLQKVEQALSRTKRFVVLLVAGITALITLIASATASAISLSQTVQTESYVNELAFNISRALQAQQISI